MAADQGTNQSVEKAAAVLASFLDGRGDLRVSDVAQRAGVGQSTASRLLATLEQLEYVERDEVSSLYRLGPAVISLAGAAVNQHPVHREARSHAQTLACSLGLGANVAVRRGGSLFYLCNFEGKLAPKSFTLLGQRNPLHATGLGKCLLLGLTPGQRRELIPEPARFTQYTITDHDALDAALAEVTERGYAVESEELALGRACVAAPVLDSTGTVTAALSISGPLSAIDLSTREAELGRIAIEVADSISIGLGYIGPGHQPAHLTVAGS
ncbi:IclR family transcriptional regulator [Prauserella marina]|uniref:Glycerol operon regulatory protein n=1 Tax=Prauserella marina TaxID=530584 RepID=A0A222VR04_9PSEU|nr:IclR family transcriptional regulator [Prauserella marina]ASR36338.1 IclR family transcriptional regulator [Prauserella marina]PWV77126.1 IclR family transcriptional regulator [Prauserella marina]SDD05033.1 DNA-binding transcriptional regulator, IclR family [Prauserella marina]